MSKEQPNKKVEKAESSANAEPVEKCKAIACKVWQRFCVAPAVKLLFPKNTENKWWVAFVACFRLGVVGGIMGVLLIAGVLWHFSRQVPDLRSLADYNPSQITRVYSDDGTVLAEYAKERRIYVAYNSIPEELVKAFLAAEDSNFFNHGGYNLKAILRAILVNVFTSRKQGASTITQQVAKTFLLSSERTYTRKIKELILARRIEDAFSKEEILELYLNQIYLGHGAYGVAAAAMTFYGKSLDELSLQQRAMLAGMPKAPSAYNPIKHPRVARLRRDVIIKRMEAEGYISAEQSRAAIASDLELNPEYLKHGNAAPHFSEHIRRLIEDNYGEEKLYRGGLSVYTTLDVDMQRAAERAVNDGLRDYDRRHGYRGVLGKLGININWQNRLEEEVKKLREYNDFGVPAVILALDEGQGDAHIGLPDGSTAKIPFETVAWARQFLDVDTRGAKIGSVRDVLSKGDIVLVRKVMDTPEYKAGGMHKIRKRSDLEDLYSLEQLPKAQAGLVAIDIKTGAVKAMVGGIDPGTGFNRAVQAKRQVGSAFKPLVYALALEQGYTPASIILDAPVVLRTGEMGKTWKPQNYSEKVYGPSTLRRGLEKSRNLMTIRLSQDLGIGPIINYAHKMGIKSKMERNLSTALGASSSSLLEMVAAYAVFPNKGQYVEPNFINRVQSANGTTLEAFPSVCLDCRSGWAMESEAPPVIEVPKQYVTDEITAYQITSLLEGVVQRGTGWRAKELGRAVGAKTGTTNDYKDAWFVGFSPDIAVGVWVGYDHPSSLGNGETGSKAAAPIWVDFMKQALKGTPRRTFDIPQGVTFVRIDADTGLLPSAATEKTVLEAFREGTEPTKRTQDKGFSPIYRDGEGGEFGGEVVNQPSQVEMFGIY